MRTTWTIALAAFVVVATVHVRHAHRRRDADRFGDAIAAARVAPHHHAGRAHRAPALFAAPLELPRPPAGWIEDVATSPRHDAPSAGYAEPVARGPPRA